MSRRSQSEWFREYKATLKCERCPETHPATLDFHHRNPDEKHSSVRWLIKSGATRERVMEEIAKCEVICANCHRKHHHEENLQKKLKVHPNCYLGKRLPDPRDSGLWDWEEETNPGPVRVIHHDARDRNNRYEAGLKVRR